MKNQLTASVLCFLLSACSGPDMDISADIEKQFETSSSTPVNLALVGPSSWERVCVIPPYLVDGQAEQILGFKWDVSTGGDDGLSTLVFIKGQEVVAYTEHPRNKGDLSEVRPQCIARADANLVRKVGEDGWVYLITEKQSTANNK
ncbi:MAG: hypothetical protein Q8K12_06635 [Thiobacillus sp.]|nr:hypothetical protein [Thiobacillus sp.]